MSPETSDDQPETSQFPASQRPLSEARLTQLKVAVEDALAAYGAAIDRAVAPGKGGPLDSAAVQTSALAAAGALSQAIEAGVDCVGSSARLGQLRRRAENISNDRKTITRSAGRPQSR